MQERQDRLWFPNTPVRRLRQERERKLALRIHSSIVSLRIALTTILVLAVLCMDACVRRDGRNNDCAWPGEANAKILDPTRSADAWHLTTDAEYAEELADRYTNVHYGPKSGYVGPPIAGAQRHACMVKMLGEVAKTHGVSYEQVVGSYVGTRPYVDFAEIVPLAIVFAFAVWLAAGRIWRRYPPAENGWPALIVILLLCSVGFGVAAVLIGPVVTATAENLRIGTGHLGARAERLPMERYTMVVFVAGIALFWIVAFASRAFAGRSQPAEIP